MGIEIVQDKNFFIQLLIQEFPGNFCDMIMDKKASAELSSLAQNKDKNLYTYHGKIKDLLKNI